MAAGAAAPKKQVDEKELNKSKNDKKKEQLNEEDQTLKDDIETLVNRCCEKNLDLTHAALTEMGEKLTTASSTMTSVPKPLKFMRPHYPTLRDFYTKNRKFLEGS